MTKQEQDQATLPGLPLWRAAERARLDEGVDKFVWVQQIGIGRRSYDRLTTQENKPITRTVKKIADRIGMQLDDAMRLAGLLSDDLAPADSGVDLIVRGPRGVTLIEVKHYQRDQAEQQMEALRKAGHDAGKSLGDVLVIVGLAEPEELKLTNDRSDP